MSCDASFSADLNSAALMVIFGRWIGGVSLYIYVMKLFTNTRISEALITAIFCPETS